MENLRAKKCRLKAIKALSELKMYEQQKLELKKMIDTEGKLINWFSLSELF